MIIMLKCLEQMNRTNREYLSYVAAACYGRVAAKNDDDDDRPSTFVWVAKKVWCHANSLALCRLPLNLVGLFAMKVNVMFTQCCSRG